MEFLKDTKLACITMQPKLPDTGDNRGKRHELAFIVVCFLVVILPSEQQRIGHISHPSFNVRRL